MKLLSGAFTYIDGTPVVNGRVFLRLSQDALADGTASISPQPISITLDSNGSFSKLIYFNDQLKPDGTTYTASVIAPGGGLVWGAESVSITGNSFTLNTAVPTTQNVLLANPVITNPSGIQTITGFPLVAPVFNAVTGFQVNGTALAASDLSDGTTGSGAIVLKTSPSLTTPSLGAATATTINKLTLTQPANGSTVTIADGKTFTVSNTLTLAGTDGKTVTFPNNSGTVAETNFAQSFTADQTFTGQILEKRIKANQGTSLTTGDFALSGWGSTASITGLSGTDSAFTLTVNCAGSGITANPLCTLTFKDGSWGTVPVVLITRGDGSTPQTGFWITQAATSAAQAVLQFVGTPVSGSAYTIWVGVIGK